MIFDGGELDEDFAAFIGRKGTAFDLGFDQDKTIADELHQYARDIIFSKEMKTSGLFDMKYAEKILRIHKSGTRDMSNQLWLLLAFSLWFASSKLEIHRSL